LTFLNTVCTLWKITRQEVRVILKSWTIRIPQEVFDWIREKAAKETIVRKQSVSMNALAGEILKKAMEADRKKGGK
jgi:uncharacterized protein (DUF2336 family)